METQRDGQEYERRLRKGHFQLGGLVLLIATAVAGCVKSEKTYSGSTRTIPPAASEYPEYRKYQGRGFEVYHLIDPQHPNQSMSLIPVGETRKQLEALQKEGIAAQGT